MNIYECPECGEFLETDLMVGSSMGVYYIAEPHPLDDPDEPITVILSRDTIEYDEKIYEIYCPKCYWKYPHKNLNWKFD